MRLRQGHLPLLILMWKDRLALAEGHLTRRLFASMLGRSAAQSTEAQKFLTLGKPRIRMQLYSGVYDQPIEAEFIRLHYMQI